MEGEQGKPYKQREQVKFLENELFAMSGDSWMKEPGSIQWTEGQGRNICYYVIMQAQVK